MPSFNERTRMKKILVTLVAAGTLAASLGVTSADARGFGRGGYHRGYGGGYHRGYGHRGIGTGAAVGLGLLGAGIAGAAIAGSQGYGGYPAYGYGGAYPAYPYGGYGY